MTQNVGHSTDINTLMMLAAAHRDHEEKSTMLTDSYAGLFEELRTWTAQSGWNTSRPGVHPSEVLQTRSDGSGLDSMKAGFQKAFGNGAAKCNRKKRRLLRYQIILRTEPKRQNNATLWKPNEGNNTKPTRNATGRKPGTKQNG